MYYKFRAYEDFDDCLDAILFFEVKLDEGNLIYYDFYQIMDMLFLLMSRYGDEDMLSPYNSVDDKCNYIDELFNILYKKNDNDDIFLIYVKKMLDIKYKNFLDDIRQNGEDYEEFIEFTDVEIIIQSIAEISSGIENNYIFEDDLMAEYYKLKAEVFAKSSEYRKNAISYRLKEIEVANSLSDDVSSELSDCYYALSSLLYHEKDIKKAVKYRLESISRGNIDDIENDVYNWFKKNEITKDLNHKMISAFHKFILKTPNEESLYYCLALCYRYDKMFDESIESIQYAISIVDANIPEYDILLAELLMAKKDFEGSYKKVDEIIKNIIQDVHAFYEFYSSDEIEIIRHILRLVKLCLDLNKQATAIDICQKIISRVEIYDTRPFRLALLNIYYSMEKIEMCVDTCNEALKYFPGDTVFIAAYVKLLLVQNKPEKAMETMQNGILLPNIDRDISMEVDIYNVLILCDLLLSIDDKDFIKTILEHIQEISKFTKHSWVFLAKSIDHYNRKEYHLAREYWEEAGKYHIYINHEYANNNGIIDKNKIVPGNLNVLCSKNLWQQYIEIIQCDE